MAPPCPPLTILYLPIVNWSAKYFPSDDCYFFRTQRAYAKKLIRNFLLPFTLNKDREVTGN